MEEIQIPMDGESEPRIGNKDKTFKFKYFTEEDDEFIRIFGEDFVKNNKNKCNLIIDDNIDSELFTNYSFKLKGEHTISLVINEEDINFNGLFDFKINIGLINSFVPINDKNYLEYFKKNNRVIDASSLEDLDTSQFTSLSHIFTGCANIKSFYFLKNWDVSKCTDFSGLFSGCSFTKLDFLEKWNTGKATTFRNMFQYCINLNDLNHIKNWNVENVEIFRAMFDRCYSLTDINNLKNWNMEKARDISWMFTWCDKLTSIDSLYKWKLSNTVVKTGIIQGCSSLKNIPSAFKNTDFCPIF